MVASTKDKKSTIRVVLIDDSEIDNMIHKALLQKHTFAVEIKAFGDSVAALRAIKKLFTKGAKKKEIPNYIFLDISMPVMDSYGFLDEYEKLNDELLNECKVVILTSSINPKDKEKSLKRNSVAGYITKPLTKEALSILTN